MQTALENLIDLLRLAEDANMARRSLDLFRLESGFKHFTYFHTSGTDSFSVSNYPEEWLDLYARRNYRLLDPVIVNAVKRGPVYTWSSAAARSDPDPHVREFFAEAARFGIIDGVTLTARIGQTYRAYLTLAADHELEQVSTIDPIQAAIVLAFLYKAFAAGNMGRTLTYIPLTPRELSCLSWLAEGKSMEDIATIVGIGSRTVRTHLESAKEKLSAQNANHMVSIATRLKLI